MAVYTYIFEVDMTVVWGGFLDVLYGVSWLYHSTVLIPIHVVAPFTTILNPYF